MRPGALDQRLVLLGLGDAGRDRPHRQVGELGALHVVDDELVQVRQRLDAERLELRALEVAVGCAALRRLRDARYRQDTQATKHPPDGESPPCPVRRGQVHDRPRLDDADAAGCGTGGGRRPRRRAAPEPRAAVDGYVPQESGVDRDATGRENLLLQGRIKSVPREDLLPRVEELLELVGIADAADRVVRGYSGGMKRLDIALGLVHRPSVLFLDEPTTGLDPEARAGMWVEVQRLAEQERLTILLTTHYLEEADRLAERVAIVSRGQIVVQGLPEELKRGLLGEAVTVELADGRGEDAVAIVTELDGAFETTADGRLLRTRVPNGAQAVPAILSALEGRGVRVASVTTHRPSLDDVYLHYTGRDFAAEEAAAEDGAAV